MCQVLDLVEQDYLWLSETPRRERSRSWGSRGERCANFALFKLRAAAASTGPPRRIIAVNTHLDVWSEPARRHQAALVARTVREWQQRFPDAVVVGFGDFNSAPGQPPHRILTAELDDAWLVCEATAACTTNDFAATFHGWMGSKVNTYAARLVSLFAFWMHGLGAEFPAHVPRTLREALRAAKIGLTTEPSSSVGDAMPAWPWLHRMVCGGSVCVGALRHLAPLTCRGCGSCCPCAWSHMHARTRVDVDVVHDHDHAAMMAHDHWCTPPRLCGLVCRPARGLDSAGAQPHNLGCPTHRVCGRRAR